jgi:hypothetical protein
VCIHWVVDPEYDTRILVILVGISRNLHFSQQIIIFFLYGCETLSLTLREEHRLRVIENRVLRRIFGPKRDEVTGGWRKLHIRSCMVCTLRRVLLE